MTNDIFANIAAGGIGGRADELEIPKPKQFSVENCILDDAEGTTPIKTVEKLSSKAELYDELSKLKKALSPFLNNEAPEIENYKKIIPIKDFLLNNEKKITIPYYGGPIGYAKQIYESSFCIDEISDNECVYICLEGADYIATVYINNVCVGMHEGFFSPFEFEITENVTPGKNELRIELKNDYIYGHGDSYEGDKLYAATGLGYDDPQVGWHHCPPGMGIYNDVSVEIRNKIHISDIFVRNGNEAWIEIQKSGYEPENIEISLSVYGQNFRETVFENKKYIPHTIKTVGMGDSLTEASVKDQLASEITIPIKNGKNIFKIPIEIKNPKLWDLETPYLYQMQVSVCSDNGICDCAKTQFGIRKFAQDVESSPKGMFYLNDRKIRLRGANTMGFEQQDVLRNDIDQLIDDILLAKLCNMNFLRLTQRPVQDEIYEYCDKLGLMTQTDLPLFGCMRRTRFCEGIRQVEEMERMVRNHPCNVIVSYINEPFPNANNEPHRHLTRPELEEFFNACDIVVKFTNPDRVIKHVDGDYDPPTSSMPDNHCYPMWYNGHGIDIGLLNKGYWLPVKPNWYYGCGEYGAEGLDFASVMKSDYPKEWIAEPFNPNNIIRAQTGNFHYFFYDTQSTMENWVNASQKHQAYATKFMTEAFRRDSRMISNAIHLFIDAWPSGWMKTIMDCKRNPKPAYFAYRDALEPILVSLRTDRYTFFEGEEIRIEAFVCNDTSNSVNGKLNYELYNENGDLIKRSHCAVTVGGCTVNKANNAVFTIGKVCDRQKYILKAILTDGSDNVITYNSMTVEVFEDCNLPQNTDIVLMEHLEPGEHNIAGEKVTVKECGMLPVHFVSRNTGHPSVAEFEEDDFKNWYDKASDMITPILSSTFEAKGFTPILTSGNLIDGEWTSTNAVAAKTYDGKIYVISQLDIRTENPIAKRFKKNLLEISKFISHNN